MVSFFSSLAVSHELHSLLTSTYSSTTHHPPTHISYCLAWPPNVRSFVYRYVLHFTSVSYLGLSFNHPPKTGSTLCWQVSRHSSCVQQKATGNELHAHIFHYLYVSVRPSEWQLARRYALFNICGRKCVWVYARVLCLCIRVCGCIQACAYVCACMRGSRLATIVGGVSGCLPLRLCALLPVQHKRLNEEGIEAFPWTVVMSILCFSSSPRYSRSVSRSCCHYLCLLYPSVRLSFLIRHRFAPTMHS